MRVPVEERAPDFRALVDSAVSQMERTLRSGAIDLRVSPQELRGPHLAPAAGAYSPLDFLLIGFSEHLAREFPFLLLVTEVDLSATGKPYVLALSSPLANIGILSTKRLAPEFWGQPENRDVSARRLSSLMLHVLGHLLNLPHSPDPRNVMYDLRTADDLDGMTEVTPEQLSGMQRSLPAEAREDTTSRHRWRFTLRKMWENRAGIWKAVKRASPVKLVPRLPAMIAAALSVIIVLFFSTEIWDVASTVELYQLLLFAVLAVIAATVVLYRTFSIGAIATRSGELTESSVVMRTATALSLVATMAVLYLGFFGLAYAGAVTIFPAKLMETWPTVDPAVRVLDHVKLGLFLAAMGVLTGSLGGRAEGKDLIRHVLFFSEET
ncbi:hypothetical protein BH23GEM4_BH23GEM4_07400 [soil metagenome]